MYFIFSSTKLVLGHNDQPNAIMCGHFEKMQGN